MSYEYYLQACENQAPQPIPTDIILSVFALDEMNHCTVYLDTNEAATDGMMISRP